MRTILIVLLIVIVVLVLFFVIRAARRRNDIDRILVDKAVDNIMQYWDKAPAPRQKREPVDEVIREVPNDHLPEFEPVTTTKESEELIDERLEEAAKLVVATQDCSRKHLQISLAIGYAHAGRILDQLEAAGIIGPMDEAQQREVLMKDLDDVKPTLSHFGFLPGSHEISDQEPEVNIDDLYLEVMNE